VGPRREGTCPEKKVLHDEPGPKDQRETGRATRTEPKKTRQVTYRPQSSTSPPPHLPLFASLHCTSLSPIPLYSDPLLAAFAAVSPPPRPLLVILPPP
jgi:hypothetical protein